MFHGLDKKFAGEGQSTVPALDGGGLTRFPTEPPASSFAATARSHASAWKGSVIGFLAGIAAMAMWRRLRS